MGITDVLEKILDKISGENIKLGEVIRILESRGFGPLLLAPALIAMLPTGAIPGIPSICGIIIFLIAIQILIGKKHPWIPEKFKEITLEREKLARGIEKIKPTTRKLDKWFKPRLTFLTEEIATRVLALLCAIVGLSMIPLEVVPFAAALPALAVSLLAVGLITEDGAIILFSVIAFLISLYFVITSFLF
jgi:hypothetical protein